MTQLGLFDITSTPPKSSMTTNPSSSSTSTSTTNTTTSNPSSDPRDLEIQRLQDELSNYRARIASFEDTYAQARHACEAWKKETALATKKAEMAIREKEVAMGKWHALMVEGQQSGGPYLHAVKRVAELKGLPMGVLKTLEWQLKRDLMEVENVSLY